MIATELSWVKENLPASGLGSVKDVQTFVCTAPGPSKEGKNQPREYIFLPSSPSRLSLLFHVYLPFNELMTYMLPSL